MSEIQDVPAAPSRPASRRLIPAADLTAWGIHYHRSHRFKLIKAGKFPKPVKGFGKGDHFLEDEIDAYVEGRIAARDGAGQAA
jgi:prophage regulatory protein